MNIKRTCEITLTKAEVMTAITRYIAKHYEYRSSEGVKSWEVVLDAPDIPETLTVLWGEEPEKEEVAPPCKSGPIVLATEHEAAFEQVETARNEVSATLT